MMVITNGIRARHRTMCQPSCCSPKGVDTRWCVSKDAGHQRGVGFGGGPTSIRGRKECQRGRCPRCVSLLAVLQRGVNTRRCASKDAGHQMGVGFGGGPTSIGGREECQQGRWPRCASLLAVPRRE